MGANIARRLKDVGYPITSVHDARPSTAAEVAAEVGARAVQSLAEVTQEADAIITVVTDDAAMEVIYAESGDSLLGGANGRLFVNCATVSPHLHVAVERLVEAAGGHSLEACMASSITQAREGTLYLMVAGTQNAYDRALPVLRAMSSDLRYVGPAGSAA